MTRGFSLQVKVLYVRNLKSDFNEEKIKELFEPFGQILRIKKLKDYAFVHFEEREHAVNVSEKFISVQGDQVHIFKSISTQIMYSKVTRIGT